MKKNLLHVIWLVLLLTILCGCNHRVEPAEDFAYEMVDGEAIITGYHGTKRELLLPDEIEKRPVTKIGAYAFSGYDMTSIKLPETLIEVGAYSFEDCNCLTKIEFPDGVIIIGEGTFAHCDALEHVVLPESVAKIEDGAFNHCKNLKEINLTTELDYLGVGALAYCGGAKTKDYRKTSMNYFAEDFETGEMRTSGSEVYSYKSASNSEEIYRAIGSYADGADYITDVVNRYDEKGRLICNEKIVWNPDGSNEKSQTWWEYDDGDETVTEKRAVEGGPAITVSTSYYADGVLSRIEYYNSDGEVYQYDSYMGKWAVEEIVSVDKHGNITKIKVQCDAFGRYQKMIGTYDGASEPYYMVEYRYDSAGNQVEMIEYNYLSNSKTLVQYTYEKVK